MLAQSAGREVLRVLVGPWSELRKDTAARKLESGPEASGVYALPDESGRRIDLLDETGDVARVLGPGGGLLAATRIEAQQPTWVVTGVDETGVAAAAAALTEDELRNRFAIAVEEGAAVPLPIVEQRAVTYRRRASPLHAARAGVGALWCVTLGLVALVDRAPGRARRAARRPCWRPPRRRGSAARWRSRWRGASRSRS